MIEIKIDRDSIARNKNAGDRHIIVPRRPYLDEAGNRVQEYKWIWLIQPIPEFSYRYIPVTITCQYCEATFSSDALEDYAEEGDWYSAETARICPKCGNWECCDELSFESFSEEMIHDA